MMMSPERWRTVDAVVQAALACEPERRAAVVAAACGDDGDLRIEVMSLLAAHVDAGDDFLERPAVEMVGVPSLAGRLAHALVERYTIEREIARGGMATVYLARDLRHNRLVAIKVLREELAAAVGAERFLAEIRVTASLGVARLTNHYAFYEQVRLASQAVGKVVSYGDKDGGNPQTGVVTEADFSGPNPNIIINGTTSVPIVQLLKIYS